MPLGSSGLFGTFLKGLLDNTNSTPFQNLSGETSHTSTSRMTSYTGPSDVRELRHQVERLALLNQAMWEILQSRLKVTDAELEKVAHDIDMRDGKADGKISAGAVRCPSCQRVSNARHYKCLYCGQLFEKPIFGGK